MSDLTSSSPEEAGLDSERWAGALACIQGWCDQGKVPAAALVVGRRGRMVGPYFFGRHSMAEGSPPIGDDAIFLIASITKPIVAMGVLRLVEQGQVSLDDRVENYVPEFGQQSKHGVTIRHLLTHTSGLPDMLPQNRELRQSNAPLSGFVDGTRKIGLDFAPGRGVQYQSMGFSMLGEVILRVTGISCAQWLHQEFFEPLGMRNTALGAPDHWFEGANPQVNRIPEIRVPSDQLDQETWNWNSRYWRQLGAPWGGLLTTPVDLARFAQMMLQQGRLDGHRILSPAAVRDATRNQLEGLKEVSADDRRCRPWGLGWRLNWPAHSANFGEFLGPRAYGHWGATGTALWIDPDEQAFGVFFTTQPQEPHGTYLARAANAVHAAFV